MPPASGKGKAKAGPPAATAPLVAMTGEEICTNTAKANAGSKRIGEMFLAYLKESNPELSQRLGLKWDDVPEKEMCNQDFFGLVASYLESVYTIGDNHKGGGKGLDTSTAVQHWSTLLQMAHKLHRNGHEETTKVRARAAPNVLLNVLLNVFQLSCAAALQEFFECLRGDGSAAAKWYSSIKQKMNRQIFQRKIYNEEALDQSANEIFLEQISELSAALARADTADAATRKLAIKTTWRMAGRGGEAAALAFTGLKWNGHFKTVFIESPQSKPSKLKMCPFPAGISRHADWLIDLADHLVHNKGATLYSTGQKCWVFPDLQPANGASTKVSNYIKAMQPKGRAGAQVTYEKFSVPSLPPHPTAAGIRPGAADMMASCVPAELVVHLTGHDLTGMSALFEYLDTRVALTIPGAIVLAGWPPLPYGQTGMGPNHPSLSCIINVGTNPISLEVFEEFIDKLFSFHDASPPMLLQMGYMRPMMHHMLATLIMYYEERFKAREMHWVLSQMRDVYEEVLSVSVHGEPHNTLIEWGRLIVRGRQPAPDHARGAHAARAGDERDQEHGQDHVVPRPPALGHVGAREQPRVAREQPRGQPRLQPHLTARADGARFRCGSSDGRPFSGRARCGAIGAGHRPCLDAPASPGGAVAPASPEGADRLPPARARQKLCTRLRGQEGGRCSVLPRLLGERQQAAVHQQRQAQVRHAAALQRLHGDGVPHREAAAHRRCSHEQRRQHQPHHHVPRVAARQALQEVLLRQGHQVPAAVRQRWQRVRQHARREPACV